MAITREQIAGYRATLKMAESTIRDHCLKLLDLELDVAEKDDKLKQLEDDLFHANAKIESLRLENVDLKEKGGD